MNNEKYNQIIDEAYENYTTYMNNNLSETRWNKTWISDDGKSVNGRRYTKEEFINKCKTNSEFSERWGLKIEERVLTLEERHYFLTKTKLLIPIPDDIKDNWIEILNKNNIPTKLITVTYKDEKIEVFL